MDVTQLSQKLVRMFVNRQVVVEMAEKEADLVAVAVMEMVLNGFLVVAPEGELLVLACPLVEVPVVPLTLMGEEAVAERAVVVPREMGPATTLSNTPTAWQIPFNYKPSPMYPILVLEQSILARGMSISVLPLQIRVHSLPA